MVNKDDLSKIGIGTWGIGGFAERDPKNDDRKQIEALKYTFNNGVNLIEATYWYAEGKAVELIKLALDESSKKRDQIFITSTIYPYRNPTLKEAEKEMQELEAINPDKIKYELLLLEEGESIFGKVAPVFNWIYQKHNL